MTVGNTKVKIKGKNVKVNKLTKSSSVSNTSSVNNKAKKMVDQKKGDPRADGALIDKKSISLTPPFILTFEISNHNVHNYLVDFEASSNMIPYLVSKNIKVEPHICKTKIIQLEKSNVKVMGELKEVLIHLTSNSRVHQMIDIIFFYIPEAYRVILSRDWCTKLNG